MSFDIIRAEKLLKQRNHNMRAEYEDLLKAYVDEITVMRSTIMSLQEENKYFVEELQRLVDILKGE